MSPISSDRPDRYPQCVSAVQNRMGHIVRSGGVDRFHNFLGAVIAFDMGETHQAERRRREPLERGMLINPAG